MVGYDSIIPPGRVGTVTPQVDISNMHGGSVKKGITIISNAKNASTLRLTISGTIKPVVGMSKSFIRLTDGADDTEIIDVETQKGDFKIHEVYFEPDKGNKTAPLWNANAPIRLNHSFEKDSSQADEDGYFTFKLSLDSPPNIDQTSHGKFVIKTNHPDRNQITIRGMVQSGKK